MQSIFQIKINQNKLQKIINQLSKQLSKQSQSNLQFNQKLQKLNNITESFETKINYNYSKINQLKQDLYTKYLKIENTFSQLCLKNFLCPQKNSQKYLSMSQEYNNKEITQNLQKKTQKQLQSHNISTDIQKWKLITQKQLMQQSSSIQKINQQQIFRLQHRLTQLQNSLQTTIKQLKHPQTIFKTLKQPITNIIDIKLSEVINKDRTIHNKKLEQLYIKQSLLQANIKSTQNKLKYLLNSFEELNKTFHYNINQYVEDSNTNSAFFSSKIKDLQNTLNMLLSTNKSQKILYPTKTKNTSQKINTAKDLSNDTKQADAKQCITSPMNILINQSNLPKKLQKIQTIKSDTLIPLQPISNIKQQITSILIKLQTFQSNITQLQNQLIKFKQHHKIQSKSHHFTNPNQIISNINSNNIIQFIYKFKNIQQNIQQKIKQMINVKHFNKTIQTVNQKIKYLTQITTDKATKSQTRKAFTFIQQKIKQIITLIADIQNTKHKTAGRKVMIQCLSCDQNYFQQNNLLSQTVQPLPPRISNIPKQSSFSVKIKDKKIKDNQKLI